MENEFCVICPHCGVPVLIIKIQCGIFRHGVVIKTKKQMPPHATKSECDEMVRKNMIYGCGKPFQIKNGVVSVCDYI